MNLTSDVNQQFADFFSDVRLKPYAYFLYKRLQEGHICIHTNDLIDNRTELPYKDILQADKLDTLTEFISTNETEIRPFVLHKDRLYLQRYFNYETQILQSVGRLLKSEALLLKQRTEALEAQMPLLQSLMANYSLIGLPIEEQVDWQLIAAVQATLHNFSIITGGPGTGKTTTVAKILSILLTINPESKIALAAPTGKAAMRMAESLKQTSLPVSQYIKDRFKSLLPNTIHLLLKYIPNSIYFKHNQSNPLPYDIIVIDEASMIDVALFAKLLVAIGPSTRIILLGDKNQLASVEAGSLFGDLCKALNSNNELGQASANFVNQFILDNQRQINAPFVSNSTHPLAEHIIELRKSHRFSSTSGIGKFSEAIIHNQEAVLTEYVQKQSDVSVIVDTAFDQNLFESFIAGYKAYILETDIAKALEKLGQLRVLCAVREGPQGLYTINKAIEAYLSKQNLIKPQDDFYENRPIIITKSYKDLKLFNGDIGIIRKDSNGNIRAWFEDNDKKIRPILPGYIADAETVYAMTIHKSQGSEYDEVMVLLPQNHSKQLLTRELLYTAVTRAKQRVIVQTTETNLMATAAATVKRASGITDRFEEL